MKKIKVPVKIITFIHKDSGQIESFVFGEHHDTAESFEGNVFGRYFNVTGFWKVSTLLRKEGHKEIITDTEIEVEV